MKFVASGSMAGKARGSQIARFLGVPCETALGRVEPGEFVVFVKHHGAAQAKQRGARVVFDPVDQHAYEDRALVASPEVDVVLVYSQQAAQAYAGVFPNAEFRIVPHNWDSRIFSHCRHDVFQPGYIGLEQNLKERISAPMVTNLGEMLAALHRFNCHVAAHEGERALLFKPATKVASAAAVGANIVTHRSHAAVELLGEDYPFFADGSLESGLEKARQAFGGPEWERGLEIMRGVKERTSLPAVAGLYREFL